MELPVRLPILPSRCYSPPADHGYEAGHGVPGSRQPLHESTGNVQHPHMAWYAQHLEPLSSIPSSIPAPSVLRTHSLGTEYGTAGFARLQQRHEPHQHGRRKLSCVNPLMPLLTQGFQNYRKKQADKPDQKWPVVLERPFLDAVLLIPQMRRKKYTMKQTQYGRNMLIGEYIWMAYCQSLAPGEEPDPQIMGERGKVRKKVSSHIQVVKKFFSNHRCFHFFFAPKQQEDEDKDSIETVSLKDNSVLIALSEGRLPDERPNYEYFAQILALNDQIQVRPKRCWIFVSHQDAVVGEDGAGYLPATGDQLAESDYPHLMRNLERDTWAKEEQQIFKGALLHEFTKEMHQVESSSVNEISKKWESAFPELHQRLKAIISTTTDARCDILHMHVTLELKQKLRFPPRSELNSWVEINIEQSRLLNHRWKVDTRLVRPSELCHSHEDSAPEVLYETSDEIAIQYQHRPGCDDPSNDGRGHCDCISQRCRRNWVTVPFPADVWAVTLTNCGKYPVHPFTDGKRHDRDPNLKAGDAGTDGSRSRRRNKEQPTQMDLVPKIAMMQEIWSCAPSSPHGPSSSKNQRWTRRALLLWTFETVHSVQKGQLVMAHGGKTNWRFLTILDPTSEYHQRHAIVNGRKGPGDEYWEGPSSLVSTSRPASRDIVMSPSPTYQQHLNPGMSESFSTTWDNASSFGSLPDSAASAPYSAHIIAQPAPSHPAAVLSGYGLLDSFSSHSGLATPPPTASLSSSFNQSFNTGGPGADLMSNYMNTQAVTTASMATGSHAIGGPLSAMTDPFLVHLGPSYDEAHSIHSWHGPSIAWPAGYPGASSANGHPWLSISTTTPPNDLPHHHDLWTPSTSTNTKGPIISATGTLAVTKAHDAVITSSQDWVHIHRHHHQHDTTASPTVASGGSDDLSQDWEEIVAPPALLKMEPGPSPPPPSSSASVGQLQQPVAGMVGGMVNGQGQSRGQSEVRQQQKGVKRGREESAEDGEERLGRRRRV